MRICPLKFHQGRPDGACNSDCVMFNDETEDCLLAEALIVYTETHCFPPKPAVKQEVKFAPPRIDESVLFSNREYRKNLKEEGF